MAKESGLGDGLFANGFDLSGDIQQVNSISSPRAVLDVTGINKSAYERIYGVKDGVIDMTTHFNTSAGQQFPTLKALPDADSHVMYRHGSTRGNAAAALVSKRTTFEMTRANDGGVTFTVNAQSNGFGLDWGVQLTPGVSTITGAGNQTSLDLGTGSLSFGWQAYMQVTGFTGTDATVRVQDSADNSSFADLSGAGFTQTTAANTYQRIAAASQTATVRRYVRLTVATTGGFSSLSYIVVFHRNDSLISF
jgi:hypothetical protein